MATWPATLPAFNEILVDSYQEIAPDNIIRTQMDIGPDKIRLRGTAAPEFFSGNFYMTSTQVGILRTFFDDTVNYGVDAFDTIHPRTTAAVSARFTAQPQIARMGAEWSVMIACEILP